MPSEHRRRRRRRSSHRRVRRSTIPAYARIAIPILLLALFGRLAWQGMRSPRGGTSLPTVASVYDGDAGNLSVPWQQDIADSLNSGVRDGSAGNLSAAEMDMDRAESFITAARLESRDASSSFFGSSFAALDSAQDQAPQNQRLFDHVTLARIALAELRSSLNPTPLRGTSAASHSNENHNRPAGNGPALDKSGDRLTPGTPFSMDGPRQIPADTTFDPATLHSDFLDATRMPDTLEVFLPPSTRSFADQTRVENLTIAGAAQTLDGIRWHNVTFVGTRLRYEGGEVELQNVHFVRCRFGFSSDQRGARLATAIGLGETSILIQ
jgi:hypothetical protein